MTGQQMTERELALAARVKELENAAATNVVPNAQGGVFESFWRTITYIVPPWLAAVALAVFVAHYGFGYYLQGQVTAAETPLRQAKADLETAKAEAANAPDDEGVPMRLATLKTQTDKIAAEAAVARASARALNTQMNGETVALQAAKAQLDKVQNEAGLAQAEADAKSAKFGESTLQGRAIRAKRITQVLKTVEQNQRAQLRAAMAQGGGVQSEGTAIVRGECLNNEFAELIGCPSQFIRRKQQQPESTQVGTAPSDDEGQYWKPRGNCLRDFHGFNRGAVHGSFAITKITDGQGGCAWSGGALSRSRESLRREALERCAKHGSDCKIISEK
jgi:hypothetical protein